MDGDNIKVCHCCACCTLEARRQAPQPLPGGEHEAGRPLPQRHIQRQLQPRRRCLHSRPEVDGPCTTIQHSFLVSNRGSAWWNTGRLKTCNPCH